MSSNRANRSPRCTPSDGFTLFEVVVALAIAAIGLGFLMSAASTGLGNAGLAYRYVEATRRVQSHLAELGVTVPLVAGVKSGDDGDGFTWSMRISPPVAHAVPAGRADARSLGIYTVEVGVSWRSGLSTKTVFLRSQRMAGT